MAAVAAAVAVETPPEPMMRYQTWVLRVSIHCEGCKKKIKRVLHSIDGVYKTDLDAEQHKVTVFTGDDVDGQTLVTKLIKSGKYAELWPAPEIIINKPAAEPPPSPPVATKIKGIMKNVNMIMPPAEPTAVALLIKTEGGGGEMFDSGGDSSPPSPSQQDHQLIPAGDLVGGGAEGPKKKKKKKKKKKAPIPTDGGGAPAVSGGEAESCSDDGDVAGGAVSAAVEPPVANSGGGDGGIPPATGHHISPELYALSYNTAHRRARFGQPYYAAAVLPPESFLYVSRGGGYVPAAAALLPEPQYEYYGGAMEVAPRHQPASYELFSEANANACCIM